MSYVLSGLWPLSLIILKLMENSTEAQTGACITFFNSFQGYFLFCFTCDDFPLTLTLGFHVKLKWLTNIFTELNQLHSNSQG